MKATPDLSEFTRLAAEYDLVPVYRRLLSDGLTPLIAFQLLDRPGQQACLFESVIGGEKVGRYSFIAVGARTRISAHGNRVCVEEWSSTSVPQQANQNTIQQVDTTCNDPTQETRNIQETSSRVTEVECDDPLEFLNQYLGRPSVAPIANLPPFVGGALGYVGYDVVRYVENLPNIPFDDRKVPDLDFGIYDQLVIFDNVTKTMMVLSLARPSEHASAQDAFDAACTEITNMVTKLSAPQQPMQLSDIRVDGLPTLKAKSNFEKVDFLSAVETCRKYIEAGDIFQVVISQRFELEFHENPFEIYRSLRVINPSPFMFYLRTPETTLIGASPEVMCRVVEGEVTVRPLAGTRPRGKNDSEDKMLAADLLEDPKERAEHVMLVDLGRNDVGRVAELGSVDLTDVMTVEHYSHVMHISSNVVGKLRSSMDAMDAMKACLPAGTVSGAPKVRAMEIIDEIEPTKRGPYAGAVGYFDYRGNMDTCIVLRTMVHCQEKLYIQAGAGIVADSDPELEYQETVNKSRAMLRAVEITLERLKG